MTTSTNDAQQPRADTDVSVGGHHYVTCPRQPFNIYSILLGLQKWYIFWKPPSSKDPGQENGLIPLAEICPAKINEFHKTIDELQCLKIIQGQE